MARAIHDTVSVAGQIAGGQPVATTGHDLPVQARAVWTGAGLAMMTG